MRYDYSILRRWNWQPVPNVSILLHSATGNTYADQFCTGNPAYGGVGPMFAGNVDTVKSEL